MRRVFTILIIAAMEAGMPFLSGVGLGKEFLTAREIERVQDAQEIHERVQVYLDAAEMRLKKAQERLQGKESEEPDPYEFFSVEDMLDGYYRIYRSLMINLDAAFQKRGRDTEKIRSALKNLKKSSEKTARELEVLKKMAEDNLKEELWNLVNQAIDITEGAREGAESGLARLPAEPSGRKSRDR
jgi:hypothetical protein